MNPPRTKDVSHMFYGLDDYQPPVKLCTAFVKKWDVSNSMAPMRFMTDAGNMRELFPTGDVSMTLEMIVLGAIGPEAQSMLRDGPCDILIRRKK